MEQRDYTIREILKAHDALLVLFGKKITPGQPDIFPLQERFAHLGYLASQLAEVCTPAFSGRKTGCGITLALVNVRTCGEALLEVRSCFPPIVEFPCEMENSKRREGRRIFVPQHNANFQSTNLRQWQSMLLRLS